MDDGGAEDVVWALGDHQNTIRDLATYDPVSGDTTVANHITYDSFGNVTAETSAAVDHLFGYTGRLFDEATGLQNNLNRWYDSEVGRWVSEDPIGFEGGDGNLHGYVKNNPVNAADSSGLKPWEGIARILGKKWTRETCERAGRRLAAELLHRLDGLHPNSQKAQEIIRALKRMGWVERTLGQGSKAGKTLDEGGGIILREMENGKDTGRILEWYPGNGPHHKEPHWKFSSTESGVLRTSVAGVVVATAIAVVPGAAYAAEGDINGAGRDVFVEVTPLAWAKVVWQTLGGFFDSCERDLYGDDYHRDMEKYRKKYWDDK